MSQTPDIITWKNLERANKVAIIVMTAAFFGYKCWFAGCF